MVYSKLKKVAALVVVMLVGMTSIVAQSKGGHEVDIKIYFPYDEAYIDLNYMGNEQTLAKVDSMLRDEAFMATIRCVEVVAQSSPEGTVDYNAGLSERRKQTIEKRFKRDYPHIEAKKWSFKSVAENWPLFHQHLEEDPNLPDRDQILAISTSDRHDDAKAWLMQIMNGGNTWKYIKANILPKHRFGASVLFIPWESYPPLVPGAIPMEHVSRMAQPTLVPESFYPQEQESPKMLFAIKSNLIWDALSIVNLGVEVPIGERWSIVGEVVHPWWRSWPSNFTMQIESYHGEVKYWLGDRSKREQLQGWSIGAYGGWGRYDIQPFKETGVQGYFNDYGLEVGYAHKIARNLNLEFTVGVAYLSTKYYNYKMAYETDEFGDIKVIPYPWRNNSMKTVFPTRCGVSLVWTIKNGGKK